MNAHKNKNIIDRSDAVKYGSRMGTSRPAPLGDGLRTNDRLSSDITSTRKCQTTCTVQVATGLLQGAERDDRFPPSCILADLAIYMMDGTEPGDIYKLFKHVY